MFNQLFKSVVMSIGILYTVNSYADVRSLARIYQHPNQAAQVQRCHGNTHCNAFYALAKNWQSIPNSFRLEGFDVKRYARVGDGYGLHKGFSLQKDRSYNLANAGEAVFYNGSPSDEKIYAQGLAVLLYLENRK